MCTLTWSARRAGGYDLFFNRDERRTRARETPPRRFVDEQSGTAFVAPRDGEGGGTWIMLNAHGVVVALLNHYPRGVVETGATSRGWLPLRCVASRSAVDVTRVAETWAHAEFAPFHLVALDRAGGSVHLRWDGAVLHRAVEAPRFLTSSSFEPAKIEPVRAAKFDSLGAAAGVAELAAFHRSHAPSDGAASICMRRPDASTRSVCEISAGPEGCALRYTSVDWMEALPAFEPAVVVTP